MSTKTEAPQGVGTEDLFGWVVEIQPGCWLAPWHGDPGRTLVRTSARIFKTQCGAFRALAHASKFSDMSRAMLEPQRMKPNIGHEPRAGESPSMPSAE